MTTIENVRIAKQEIRNRIEHNASIRDYVVGVGVCKNNGEHAIRVNVSQEIDKNCLPTRVNGIEICVRLVGNISKVDNHE